MSAFRDKFGRRDPDLSPRHDAIMWWLDEQLRAGKLNLSRGVVDADTIEWEGIIPTDSEPGRFPVAFADILVTFKFEEVSLRIGFEIKPQIHSIGELLRQLKTYKHLDKTVVKWVVVSPANELAEKAVRREGFGWLDVPAEVLVLA